MIVQECVIRTAFGQDMLEVLAERQLEKIAFRELDIPRSIVTLKGYLAAQRIQKHWHARCQNWDLVLSQLEILFAGRAAD